MFVPRIRSWIGKSYMNRLLLLDLLSNGNFVDNEQLLKEKTQKGLVKILECISDGEMSQFTKYEYVNAFIESLIIQNDGIKFNMKNAQLLIQELRSLFIEKKNKKSPFQIEYQNDAISICKLRKQNEQKKDNNEEEVEAKKLLNEWGLGRYWDAMKNEGWDDSTYWKDISDDMLEDMKFKPGHTIKFKQKVRLLILEALEPDTEDKEDENDENEHHNHRYSTALIESDEYDFDGFTQQKPTPILQQSWSKNMFADMHDVKLEELMKNEIGCLGIGAFARVTLVENPHSKQVFALKKMRKNLIVETSQQEHILNEKNIMAALDNPFCVKLFATFKDELNVYFLMEPVLGGELFSLLRHTKTFRRRTAAPYCGCAVLALEYLHTELNVIYRDLKPENIMIANNGYCKLTDFGFAKKRNDTSTLCGTPQYLAPEVIRNYAHGFAVDWWTLGILLYEMIFGYPPFEADKHIKMYEKILISPVEFPENEKKLKPATKNIINSLLRKESQKRLGSGAKDALEIKNHDFFRKLDWNKLGKQQIDSPWKPTIKSTHDLSAFDRFPDIEQEDEKLMDDPDGSVFKWCQEF